MSENTPTINDIVRKLPYIAEKLPPEEVMRWIVIQATHDGVDDWRDGLEGINWPAIRHEMSIHNNWLREHNFLSPKTERRMKTVLENMNAAMSAARKKTVTLD